MGNPHIFDPHNGYDEWQPELPVPNNLSEPVRRKISASQRRRSSAINAQYWYFPCCAHAPGYATLSFCITSWRMCILKSHLAYLRSWRSPEKEGMYCTYLKMLEMFYNVHLCTVLWNTYQYLYCIFVRSLYRTSLERFQYDVRTESPLKEWKIDPKQPNRVMTLSNILTVPKKSLTPSRDSIADASIFCIKTVIALE